MANLDFALSLVRANRRVARWAKRLTKLYYNQEQVYNYWNGCSLGGRQGMEMAQDYGDQFDVILWGG